MDTEALFSQLTKDLDLEGLSEQDQEDTLMSLAQAVHEQFLMDAYPILGEEQFAALEASAAMGNEFYFTTLKHLLPNHEEVFQASRKKILDAYKNATPNMVH